MSLSTNLSPDRQREMLRQMLTIRRFEERASADYLAGNIYGCSALLYRRGGGVAVGVCSTLGRDDGSSRRIAAMALHRQGADLNRMMAELYGRQGGYCKGKGGSMHIADFGIGMLGANGIVAGGISIITGAGLAAQMDGKGAVAVSFFGDGASNAGPFHECLNIAATWKLPMLYVCEKQYVRGADAAAKTHALPNVAARAAGYGIPGDRGRRQRRHRRPSGTSQAVERGAIRRRADDRVSAKTYRWRGHTERKGQPDPRDRAEVEAWQRAIRSLCSNGNCGTRANSTMPGSCD